jgi:hypothetical protein
MYLNIVKEEKKRGDPMKRNSVFWKLLDLDFILHWFILLPSLFSFPPPPS